MTVFCVTDSGSWDKRQSNFKIFGELLQSSKTVVSELLWLFMKALRFYGSKDLHVEETAPPKICGPRQVVRNWPRKLPVEKVVSSRINLDAAVPDGFELLSTPGTDRLKALVQPTA